MTKIGKKRWALAAAVVVVLAALVAGGSAVASAADRNEAKQTAMAYVPSDAVLTEQEKEEETYEFTFLSADGLTEYEVEVSRSSGNVTEVKTSLVSGVGAESVTLTEEEVEAIVLENWTEASMTSLQLVTSDGLYLYDVSFEADDYYGSAEIQAETGEILESKVRFGTPIVIPVSSDTSGSGTTYLSEAEIRTLALTKIPEGTIRDIDLELQGDTYIYEVEMYYDGTKYELVYDAITGEELSCITETGDYVVAETTASAAGETAAETTAATSETTASSDSQILDSSEIEALVLAKASGSNAVVTELTLKTKKSTKVYKGEMLDDTYEYEFEVDAYTGAVLEWEKEARDSDSSKATTAADSSLISQSEAEEIALSRAEGSNAYIKEIELDTEDGTKVYEGEMRDDTYEYEFEIDAYTGAVIEWEREKRD